MASRGLTYISCEYNWTYNLLGEHKAQSFKEIWNIDIYILNNTKKEYNICKCKSVYDLSQWL